MTGKRASQIHRVVKVTNLDGIVDLFGIVVGRGSHQADDETLKFASQLIFQIINQVLLKQ